MTRTKDYSRPTRPAAIHNYIQTTGLSPITLSIGGSESRVQLLPKRRGLAPGHNRPPPPDDSSGWTCRNETSQAI